MNEDAVLKDSSAELTEKSDLKLFEEDGSMPIFAKVDCIQHKINCTSF
mgnify:CR=1 FL=1